MFIHTLLYTNWNTHSITSTTTKSHRAIKEWQNWWKVIASSFKPRFSAALLSIWASLPLSICTLYIVHIDILSPKILIHKNYLKNNPFSNVVHSINAFYSICSTSRVQMPYLPNTKMVNRVNKLFLSLFIRVL